MKGGKGLKSSTSLGSSSSSLGGGDQFVPQKTLGSRKLLKARSSKMQRLYEESRIPFVQDFLERNPQCAFLMHVIGDSTEDYPVLGATRNVTRCPHRADDVHEIVNRARGGNLVPIDGQNEAEQFLGLCRRHHTWVTTHPLKSKELGYSR
jgi:hypothetical protein